MSARATARCAVVTGGTGGIGAAIAEGLASAGPIRGSWELPSALAGPSCRFADLHGRAVFQIAIRHQ
jgi:nucleoside-diphosphate-sugar epimerase